VVGIVASRLVDRYHRPVILLTEGEDGLLRGSARSIEGLNITEAIAASRDILLGFGGHPMAAGLSLERDKMTEFRRRLRQAVEAQLGQIIWEEPALQIDAWLGFNDLTFDLADALEKLAPFGAGNPPLALATRNLQLKSAIPIGKTKEHLRLVVEDEQGQTQSILWWGGAGEELPETGQRIDIAYSLRAGAFRGERQLTLQLLDYRLVEIPTIEVQPPAIEVIDWRKRAGQIPAEAQVFAEGEHRQKVGGVDRYHLKPASQLVVYTAPAGAAEWRAMLERTAPQKLYLIAFVPAEEKADAFLTRLGGLVKYAIHRRGGSASLQELSAACAQREDTVRLGLAWLEASGHLVMHEEDGSLHFSAGSGQTEPYLQRELYVAIKGLLAETAAYRAYFREADPEKLLKV
jgi:single-stranded-DNA-specific exonuclease